MSLGNVFDQALPCVYNTQILVLTGWIIDLEVLASRYLIKNVTPQPEICTSYFYLTHYITLYCLCICGNSPRIRGLY